MAETGEVAQALSQSTDDLLVELGTSLASRQLHRTFSASRKDLIEQASGWLEANRIQISGLVCGSGRVKSLARQDVATHELIVAVCGGLDLGAHLLGGVPVVTVAVLIVRLGLHRLCSDIWEPVVTKGEEESV